MTLNNTAAAELPTFPVIVGRSGKVLILSPFSVLLLYLKVGELRFALDRSAEVLVRLCATETQHLMLKGFHCFF